VDLYVGDVEQTWRKCSGKKKKKVIARQGEGNHSEKAFSFGVGKRGECEKRKGRSKCEGKEK